MARKKVMLFDCEESMTLEETTNGSFFREPKVGTLLVDRLLVPLLCQQEPAKDI